ncbi:hypothetical protein J7M23_08170 [Candidatus Sumerlaeota bacterium]|nr:hypothetical protein [Candidatus Sumerlaeota bacterium]
MGQKIQPHKRLSKLEKEEIRQRIYRFLAENPLHMHRTQKRGKFLRTLAKEFGVSYRTTQNYYDKYYKAFLSTPCLSAEEAKIFVLLKLEQVINNRRTPPGVRVTALSVYAKVSGVPERKEVEHSLSADYYDTLIAHLRGERGNDAN